MPWTSRRALTNSSGTVANSYSYDAYGNTTASSGTVYNPFKYAGEYQYAESTLYYLRARYYDPQTQQLLTVDPALAWTEEAYAYVGGNPIDSRDPLGLCDAACAAAVAGGVAGGTDVVIGAGSVIAVAGPAAVVVVVIGIPVFILAEDGARMSAEDEARWIAERAAGTLATPSQCPVPTLPSIVASKGETEPTLPPHVIVDEGGVTVDHNYKGNDHGPAHLHVEGNGPSTRIGQKGYPLAGDPPLSKAQENVINDNLGAIKRAVGKIGRWLAYKERNP